MHTMSVSTRRVALALFAVAITGCGGPGGTTDRAGSAGDTSAAQVMARIGDHEITLEAIDEKAMATSVKPYQGLYDARKQALDELVSDYLLETEAAARGLTKDALIRQEVTEKIASPTAEQVKSFYDQNPNAMRGRPLEELEPQIRNYLVAQAQQAKMNQLLSGLRSKNKVEVSLEPPRVSVTVAANDPVKGPAGAPVQILEFSDFQ